jgi:hypothetical protein
MWLSILTSHTSGIAPCNLEYDKSIIAIILTIDKFVKTNIISQSHDISFWKYMFSVCGSEEKI